MRIKIELPDKFSFATEMQVRVSDVNYAGHLSNDRVLSLVHEARARFLRQYGCTELDVFGVGTIMIDAALVYKSEAFCGDCLTVRVSIGNLTSHGCDFYYRLDNKATGKEVARARTGLVFFNYERRKIRRVPEQFRALCEP